MIMNIASFLPNRLWLRGLAVGVTLATTVVADDPVVVSPAPMEVDADGSGAHGQLFVASEILSEETEDSLIYTITREPQYGRVGLAGGESGVDIFETKTSAFGYFAYRPEESYEGTDSFAYTVRNETSGLTFQNEVIVYVTPPPPLELDAFAVEADRLVLLNVTAVALNTRPNTPIKQSVPSHADYMTPEDRQSIANPKIVYALDDAEAAQNGSAKLDRDTGELTYAPNPGFIGEDEFIYYTFDENNPQFGVENSIVVTVEPIRRQKQMTVDRSKSREIDLVFVINNSRSMAPHQERISSSLSRFRQLFDQREWDYRIGVLTTDFVNRRACVSRDDQSYYKRVRSVEFDESGNVVLDRKGRPKKDRKRVASNGNLVSLPVMAQPWVTPDTSPDVFAELVRVGTNGSKNRTAFTSVYNFVADYYQKQHSFLRPEATTIVVFFMDEEETRMAAWETKRDGSRHATWIENGELPDLIADYNDDNPASRLTLDGYLNYWVLRPFIIAKGNRRGNLEIQAVVSSDNVSHRRAAELTGGSVLDIESEFSEELAALGDRIAETVAVALNPIDAGASFYPPSLRVLVNGEEVPANAKDGYTYDRRSHSIRFAGPTKDRAFDAIIEISYEEHL